jgi:hypothetical protein
LRVVAIFAETHWSVELWFPSSSCAISTPVESYSHRYGSVENSEQPAFELP